jgi:hypothetical protein
MAEAAAGKLRLQVRTVNVVAEVEKGLETGGCGWTEKTDGWHSGFFARLLCARRERPSSRHAAGKCDEIPSPHRMAPQAEGLTLPCCGLHCASRQILTADVRLGSLTAALANDGRGRFTPKSGRRAESGWGLIATIWSFSQTRRTTCKPRKFGEWSRSALPG